MSTDKPTISQVHPKVIMTDLSFGETPRWHNGKFWVSDWGTHEIIALDSEGHSEVIVRMNHQFFQPICMDWLPDGRMLVVSSAAGKLLQRNSDGSLTTYADLSKLSDKGWNEIVVDGRGNA